MRDNVVAHRKWRRSFAISWALLGFLAVLGVAEAPGQGKPQIGAQIWIEPGQTPEEIDGWFAQLESMHMPVARLFLMWPHMEVSPGHWDFGLYDAAFRAAEKHHIRVVATLTPNGPPPFRGGDGTQGVDILKSDADVDGAVVYLRRVVERYQHSSALDTWLLVNEPGQRPTASPRAVAAFQVWAAKEYGTIEKVNAVWGTNFSSFGGINPSAEEQSWNHNRELDWRTFWESFQSEQLRWLANQVRSMDSTHPLHLNPAGIAGNLADVSDDLPAWRGFLDTLGCSIHPAWHFGLFARDRYALGVSYTNDLVRGSIEPKPYWVTELQGGNNIYSGIVPMEPTADDIAQWTWTSVASGANRVIYWLLNARRAGVEAGEWSLLDLAQQPSERLETASRIAKVIDDNSTFFSAAKPVPSPITVVLSLQTMTFEEVFRREDDPARGSNAQFLEAMGFYEAFSRLGTQVNVKYFDDYDWSSASASRRVVVVPDAREMSEQQIVSLKAFVEHGNTLLISGLSGFYGPHAKAWALAGFPLGKLTGGKLKEVHLSEATPSISLLDGPPLPSRLWFSSITLTTAKALSKKGDEIVASGRSLPGGGSVIWIPSPIGLGAWSSDAQPLSKYLQHAILPKIEGQAFAFADPVKGCLLRVLEHSGKYLTVVTNGNHEAVHCVLKSPGELPPSVLWGQTVPTTLGKHLTAVDLSPRATSVLLWR